MTETVTLETKFVIPDDMDEDNVHHVLSQFFGDLIRTDRFIDARIVEESTLDESEKERLIEMLENVDDDNLDQLDTFIDAYTE
jgi:phosphoenolpyruvate carboxylase